MKNRKRADEEVMRLCEDKDGLPITYNHYYTDNVQKARTKKSRDLIEKALRDTATHDYAATFHISNTPGSLQKLVDAVQQKVIVNMDDQACSEARDALSSYYKVSICERHEQVIVSNIAKVARKTFVDNVCVQVVERHLLKTLPRLFSPEIVAGYPAEELLRIAGEDESTSSKRRELQAMVSMFQDSLVDLYG